MNFEYANLSQALSAHATNTPDHVAVVFLENDVVQEINYAKFNQQARGFAQAISSKNISQDDLVILVLPHCLDLLYAFWGALYLGAIPSIFPFLTEKLDPELYLERVQKLVAHSKARAVITYPEFHEELSKLLESLKCEVISVDQINSEASNEEFNDQEHEASRDKIAFLQHSSGTTGLQKGVALSNQSVLNQLTSYSQAIKLSANDVIVSWLPLYHDMGLITGFILPLVAGIPLVLMSPFEWIRKPYMLLNAIQQYRGTITWLPNFAFNHIARTLRPQFVEGLDLNTWRAVINCSEPVFAESQRVFIDKLSEYGLEESALSTCYAMAENTFAVTQTKMGQPPRIDIVDLIALQEQREVRPAISGKAEVSIVSCGKPIEGTELKIISDGAEVSERHVGEIAVRGSSLLTEYYHRPNLTAEHIRDNWYFTGDMGYIADGDLFITGRKKDLIIVGGKNIYPQDLEAIANQVEGIYPGRAVAFGLFDDRLGTESVVLVCEMKGVINENEQYQLEKELRVLVSKATEIALSDIRLVTERWVIKTSSGKIARDENRKKYLKEFRSE